MQKQITLLALVASATLHAAVPLHWTVETSRATPAQFEAYQGETLALEAALQSYGKPLEAPSNYSLYWQTNGMGNAWWSQEVLVGSRSRTEKGENSTVGLGLPTTTNVLFATWSPTNDVGAKVYNCFIGQPGTIYHAAFQLRLRPSPGATPNELPLPQKVIDFAKVTVLNPPWSGGGGGGGVDTNAVIDIIHRTVDGSARMLPPYLHYLEMDDTYPDAAAEWYAQADYSHGSCSAVRDGNTLSRNYDWTFDFMPEFVVRIPASTVPSAPSPTGAVTSGRFASIAVCNVGTNLTEADVTSGKHSKWYKALPGHAVDGINENGVCAEINVVDGDPHFLDAWPTNGTIHCLGAVRWVLDNATNAASAATDLAAGVYFPSGLTQNFHWMIADSSETWIVENGEAHQVTNRAVMTNFTLYPAPVFGPGWERHDLLLSSDCCITNAWYTRAYSRSTNWISEFRDDTEMEEAKQAWETHTREQLRGHGLWQTVHTSVYDLTNLVLRICVQETPDWYSFSLPPGAAGVSPVAVREIVEPMIISATNALPTKAEVGEKLGTSGAWTVDEDWKIKNVGDYDIIRLGDYGWEFLGVAVSSKSIGTDDGYYDAKFSDSTGNYFDIGGGIFGGTYVRAYGFEGAGYGTVSAGYLLGSYNLTVGTKLYVDDYGAKWNGSEIVYGISVNGGAAQHGDVDLTIPVVSATDTTFSNAVDQIVRSLMPTKLRAYDPVRQCWWNIQPVNGVLTLTVED